MVRDPVRAPDGVGVGVEDVEHAEGDDEGIPADDEECGVTDLYRREKKTNISIQGYKQTLRTTQAVKYVTVLCCNQKTHQCKIEIILKHVNYNEIVYML